MISFFETIKSFFVSNAWAQGQAPAPGQAAGPSFSFFLPLVAIFLIFYFLMIRPQQKQQKERLKMISELKKGDTIVTTSGIHGRIVGIAEKILTVEIGDNIKIKLERDAVGRVKPQESNP
jgi:preprotein translocase subunit YajC